jgi:hypothetical protein
MKSALHVQFTLLDMWLATSIGYIPHGVHELGHAGKINCASSDCPGGTVSRKLRYNWSLRLSGGS